jgi:hypothetical protein
VGHSVFLNRKQKKNKLQLVKNKMPIKAASIAPANLLFSKTGYTYGPHGKIVYVDYEEPRQQLDVMMGPFVFPFGLSAYDNSIGKLSVTVNIPDGSDMMNALEELDTYATEYLSKNLAPSWTPHVPPMRYVENCYTPMIQRTPYGGSLRLSLRPVPDDANRVRTLLMEKIWMDEDDHSKGYLTKKLEYGCLDDILEMFPHGCGGYVLARLNGFSFSKTDIRAKWEAVQVIKDSTHDGKIEQVKDKGAIDYYTTPISLDFLDN